MELFNNSFRNSTDEQLTTDALLGITATICCFICLLVLVAQAVYARCYNRSTVCGSTIKRLVVGLTVATMLCQLVFALYLVRYFYPEVKYFCEVEGFLTYISACFFLFMTLGMCIVLFFEVLKVTTSWKLVCYEKVKGSTFTCCERKINKLEIAILASVFALPLLYVWIPFITNSYGPSGNFCWFRDKNCSEHSSCTAGLWEEIWLSTVPFGFVGFLLLLLFTVSLCLLGYRIKNARVDRRALIEVGVTKCIFFLGFLIITIVSLPLQGIYYSSLMFPHFIVIFIPVTITLVPLTLLVAIHLPFSSMIVRLCHKRPRQDHTSGQHNQTALQRSSNQQQPSHTTWTPAHSYCEPSEITPFVRYEQQQDYGNSGRDIN